MRMWRYKVLLPVFAFFMFLVACLGANVSAEDGVISIGISSDSVVMNLMPGQFDEETQTITARTSSEAGYTVRMRAT